MWSRVGTKPRVWHAHDPARPAAAVLVDRRTPWGNPFRVGDAHPLHNHAMTPAEVIAVHRALWDTPEQRQRIRDELRGKDLVCWCAPEPCHADFYLEVANA